MSFENTNASWGIGESVKPGDFDQALGLRVERNRSVTADCGVCFRDVTSLIISRDGEILSTKRPLKTIQRAIQMRLDWEAAQEWKLPDGCEWVEKDHTVLYGSCFTMWLTDDGALGFSAIGAGSDDLKKLVACRELMAKRHGVEL